jgi:hypothetical protein
MIHEIDIIDTSFAHAPGMSWYNVPKYVKWVRGRPGRVPVRFFTDRSLGQVDNYPADVNVALLIEPICFDETGYNICLEKLPQFKYALTYDENFKQKLGDKGLLYAIGGCWLRPEEIGIGPKPEVCSIIVSEKRQTHGHQLRHTAVGRYPGHLNVFGRGYQPIRSKAEALSKFRFSVVIENGQIDTLFTEKLIDCFLTGTIPIYWGTHKIAEHFNMAGVIQWDTLDDLDSVMHTLHPAEWNTRLEAIKDNFDRAQNYRVAEDWIFSKFPFLLP